MLEGGVVEVSCSRGVSETTPPPTRPRLQVRPRPRMRPPMLGHAPGVDHASSNPSQHPSLAGLVSFPTLHRETRDMNITKIYISVQPCIRKQLLFLLGASPHSQSGCGVGPSNGPWPRGARARTHTHAHTHTGSEGALVCGSRSDWFGVVTYSQMSCGADEQDEPDGAVGGPAGRNVPTEKHAESCSRRGSWFPPNISPMPLS